MIPLQHKIPKTTRIHFCPLCNKGKLLVEDTTVNKIGIQLSAISDETGQINPKLYIKCPICKSQIGLSILP